MHLLVFVGVAISACTHFAYIKDTQLRVFAEYAFPVFLVIASSVLIFASYRRKWFN
ncbi:hypothetical protein HY627_00955 [Candidatus Uhrbacteria bacterium]|nr:hypothetical protein [Candidatus Uhrbacteria bacterium]